MTPPSRVSSDVRAAGRASRRRRRPPLMYPGTGRGSAPLSLRRDAALRILALLDAERCITHVTALLAERAPQRIVIAEPAYAFEHRSRRARRRRGQEQAWRPVPPITAARQAGKSDARAAALRGRAFPPRAGRRSWDAAALPIRPDETIFRRKPVHMAGDIIPAIKIFLHADAAAGGPIGCQDPMPSGGAR